MKEMRKREKKQQKEERDKVGRRGLERRKRGRSERLFGFRFDDDGPGSGP